MTKPINSGQAKSSFQEDQTTLLSSIKEILIKLRKETKPNHSATILQLIDKIEKYNNPQVR